MRILLVTACYLPTANGVSYHISDLKQSLEQLGHAVLLLAPAAPGFTDTQAHILRYPSLPNPLVKNYPLGIPLVSLSVIKNFQPDVIHVHHPLLVGRFAVSLSRKLNRPLFFTCHTFYEEYLKYYFPVGYRYSLEFIIRDLRRLAAACFTVVCPSPQTQTRLKTLGIANTQVVYNGVDTDFFSPPSSFSPNRRLIYTGRLDREKNLPLLIPIARLLAQSVSDFHLTLAGDGNQKSDLVRLVKSAGLENNITFAGLLPRSQLPAAYHTASLFITPSLTEVLPLTVLEAMACGLPVIALEGSRLESVVIPDHTGFILPPDPAAIAAHLTRLFHRPRLLSSLSRSARTAAQNFSSAATAARLLSLYQSAAVI